MAPRGPGSRIWRSVPCHARQQSSPPTGEAVECKDPHLHGRSSGSGSRVREAGGPEVRFWEVASITVMFSLGRLDRKNRTSGRSPQTFRNGVAGNPALSPSLIKGDVKRHTSPYCGTYEVREKEGQVIHRPELAEWPYYIGSDQVRNFRLEGDRLILSLEETPPNGECRRSQITWERVTK